MNNTEIKYFIANLLKENNTSLDAHEILDAINCADATVQLVSNNIINKYAKLGIETIPKIGFTHCISNDWWELQDPSLKQLFPELSVSDEFQFLVMVIEDVSFDKKKDSIRLLERRYLFKVINKIC